MLINFSADCSEDGSESPVSAFDSIGGWMVSSCVGTSDVQDPADFLEDFGEEVGALITVDGFGRAVAGEDLSLHGCGDGDGLLIKERNCFYPAREHTLDCEEILVTLRGRRERAYNVDGQFLPSFSYLSRD
jgi:hypothetical protein